MWDPVCDSSVPYQRCSMEAPSPHSWQGVNAKETERRRGGSWGSFYTMSGHIKDQHVTNTHIWWTQLQALTSKITSDLFYQKGFPKVQKYTLLAARWSWKDGRWKMACVLTSGSYIRNKYMEVPVISFVFVLLGQAQSQRQHLPVSHASYLPRKSANSKWWGAYHPSLGIVHMCSANNHIFWHFYSKYSRTVRSIKILLSFDRWHHNQLSFSRWRVCDTNLKLVEEKVRVRRLLLWKVSNKFSPSWIGLQLH